MTPRIRTDRAARRSLSYGLLLAAVLSLGGCGKDASFWMTPEEKATRAFPPSEAFRRADAALASALAAKQAELEAFRTEVDERLLRRVRDCLDLSAIGRLADVTDVQASESERHCLARRDGELTTWLRMRAIARMLAQPPAHAAKPLAAITTITAEAPAQLLHVTVAARADIGVVADSAGGYRVIEASTGKVLRTLAGRADPAHRPALSPNGRVAAIPDAPSGLAFFDVETGERVWTTQKTTHLLAWIVGSEAAIVAGDNHEARVVDLRTGRTERHPTSGPDLIAVLGDPPAAPLALLLGPRELSIVQHERVADAVAAWPKRTASSDGFDSTRPDAPAILFDGRRLVGAGHENKIFHLDLGADPVRSADWNLATYAPWTGPVKLDEKRTVVLSHRAGHPAELLAVNVEDGTVAAFTAPLPGAARLASLGERPGIALIEPQVARFTDGATTAPVQFLRE